VILGIVVEAIFLVAREGEKVYDTRSHTEGLTSYNSPSKPIGA
jgi:hypothetical protein